MDQGRSYGVYAGNVPFQPGDYHLRAVASIDANSATTQAAGTPVNAEVTAVASAGAGYSVTLPPSSPGLVVTILLTTASNTCKVYPNALGTGSEKINALSANASITMAALTRASFYCVVAGQWWTLPLLPS